MHGPKCKNVVTILYKSRECIWWILLFSGTFLLRRTLSKIYLGRIAMLTCRRICSGQIRYRFTVQLGSTTDGTTTFRHTGHLINIIWYTNKWICIFYVTQMDPETPWWWKTTAETCRSQKIEYSSVAKLCMVLVIIYYV
jgi:hypothetical protein